ncbi:MAG: hypothetical protein HWD59_03720 [Coxiellaceae bacterium]|nr:MAG: hypothetical protein HWD59_03720 [Coxiellaceae bacterium]
MAEIEANIIPPQRFEQWEYFENIRLNLLEIQQDYLLSQSRTNQNMSS